MACIVGGMDGELPSYCIAGVDEVGRGPLAGPVVAAAVVLDPARSIPGLCDSKKLDASQREALDQQIRECALQVAVAEASVAEIDALNILHASLLAMQRAVTVMPKTADLVLVDGNRCPVLNIPSAAVVKGDDRVLAISAASIIAKVARDRFMVELHEQFPEYGFDRHKGYPTAAHQAALEQCGATDWHRRSFAPVQRALALGRSAHSRTALS